MFSTPVGFVLAFLIVGVFGFLNGWLTRRLLVERVPATRSESVVTVTTHEHAAAPEIAGDSLPRAVLVGAGDADELETYREEGMTARLRCDGEAPVAAAGELRAHVDESLRRRNAELEHRLAELEALLEARDEEVRALGARVGDLDPLVDQVRQREEWLRALQVRHEAALTEKERELDTCARRIAQLEDMVGDLQSASDLLNELGGLNERVEFQEAQQRESAAALRDELSRRDAEIERLRRALPAN